MRVRFKLVKADTSVWDKMERRLLASPGKTIRVGWWQSQHPSGVPTAQVAAWNEEGHLNGGIFSGTYTPPRPFIRQGFIPEVAKLVKTYIGEIDLIAQGKMTWTAFYKKQAESYVELMQETILKWDKPANKPSTQSIKGFNDPLIETGSMYDSVKFKVVRYSVSFGSGG